ncbi:protein transport protein Sec24A-like isoform X2 [Babylonia areolata]|uniref:protein transport protein Sec24A-like isoform X2 n=1 Tax=Babylonia areolata TaxID=304850 RepID=UPI003FD15D44
MADSNYPQHAQDGQHIFPPQFRPQMPPQVNQNMPDGQGPTGQGPPKVGGQPYTPMLGQMHQGMAPIPPNSMMTMGPPHGQAPFPAVSGNASATAGPPQTGGNLNGFAPPGSQGPGPQGPAGINRPPVEPTGGATFQPSGNFRPPISGQSVPPVSYNSPFPPSGVSQTVNGKNTPPLAPSTQQPFGGQGASSRFPHPPMSQGGGPRAGAPRMPVFSSQPPPAGGGPPPQRMAAPPTATGTSSAPPVSASSASGSSTPNLGLLKPPSQRSSRDPSPVNEQSYDALEGQFSPGQGNPSPQPGQQGSNRGSPFPAPGSQPAFLPSQGKGTPPSQGQSMTPPPRPGVPGGVVPQGVGNVPTGGNVGAQPPVPQVMGQPQRPGYTPMPPYSGSGAPYQPGPPPARPTGPPTGPMSGPPSSGPGPFHLGPPTSGLSGPPSGPPGPFGFGPPGSGQGSAPPGPPSGPSSFPPGPFSRGLPPTSGQGSGPPSGPYNVGPPALGQGSGPPGPPSGPYNIGPPASGQGSGPPSGPYNVGPPASGLGSGPPGPPSGPYNVGPPASGQGSGHPGPPSGPYNAGPPGSGQLYQPPPSSQGMVCSGPPPPSGPAGVPPGPASGPRGPYNQPGYPQPGFGQNAAVSNMAGDFNRMGVNDSQRVINLMQEKKLIPENGVETVRPNLYHDHKRVNCHPDVFRCTLNAIPQTSALLNKARLPLGILIHPFKDLSQLPVIQSSVIVRCRSCRTYINPFVTFVDQRRWKCNLCFRVNDLPDEFSFDPVSKSYGEPQRRPEIRSATIEFIAPSEYMLRPPQPAVYLFILDVSFNAVETGYLQLFTQTLVEELDRLPGDARTQIGFICFDRSLYFFNLSEGLSQPQMMVVPDLEDVFLPCPDSLMVNLHERRDMVTELLTQMPALFEGNLETGNALGSALQAGFKLLNSTGGRMTVVQTTLPTVGPGALDNREAASKNASRSVSNLGPSSDFYKKLALDCSGQQVAVDLFMLNGQYADIATVSCISKYSGGCVQYYPSFHAVRNPAMSDKFESDLRRYFTRKIGFEAVMRIRCTRGISIHTFHGNFFVRSTDLLSLPNVNPDAGFGMQMSIEENLTESSNVCFQAALLYTSSKGERRIRVHSLCVPVTNQLSDVFTGADQQAIASLLAKMAVDRTISSSLDDARDAMLNACQDMLNAYATQIPASQRVGALMAPYSLRLLPLFTLAMLKSTAFRISANIRVDDRVYAHLLAKCLPTGILLQTFYPHLYPVHGLSDEDVVEHNKEKYPRAPRLQLSSANIDRHGVYVLDQGENMYMMVGGAVPDAFCQSVFNVPNFGAIPDGMTDLPEVDNPTSERLRSFLGYLMDARPGGVSFLVLREDSKLRHLFFQHMVEDRAENSKSYYEFLQFVQQKVKG